VVDKGVKDRIFFKKKKGELNRVTATRAVDEDEVGRTKSKTLI